MKKIIVSTLLILASVSVVLIFRLIKTNTWQKSIFNELQNVLVDPESAQIDYLCYAEDYKTSIYYKKSPHAACALVNSKNRMGGYSGRKLMAFHLSIDNKEASVVERNVCIPDICKDICLTRSWGKTDNEAEMARYIFDSKF